MDLRRSAVAALALLFLLISALTCHAEETNAKYDPSLTAPNQSKSKQSLLDFSLHQINSANRDYGWCINQDRVVLLNETINNRYFWSNVACLGLMAALFSLIIFQHKRSSRDKWRLAEVVAQYDHALLRAQAQLKMANDRNEDLMHFISGVEEPVPQPVVRREIPASSVVENSKQASGSQKSVSAPVLAVTDKVVKAVETVRGTAKAKVSNAQIGLFNDGDVIMKINSQEQQITELRGQVGLLRGQLTESEQKLRTEKEKNRTLKGA